MGKWLNEKTISELAPLVKNKEISPVEIVNDVLEQILPLFAALSA
ncbi:hypothetical protein [Parageobacillus sp. VR-IP]|nr:hypothetical protein [Parageobacillus sp. VR-IP]